MPTALARRLSTQTCSVKRAPAPAGGKIGAATLIYVDVPCGEVDPVNAETLNRLGIESPASLVETFVFGDYDILNGDKVIIEGVERPVKEVQRWPGVRSMSESTRRVIMEDLKR